MIKPGKTQPTVVNAHAHVTPWPSFCWNHTELSIHPDDVPLGRLYIWVNLFHDKVLPAWIAATNCTACPSASQLVIRSWVSWITEFILYDLNWLQYAHNRIDRGDRINPVTIVLRKTNQTPECIQLKSKHIRQDARILVVRPATYTYLPHPTFYRYSEVSCLVMRECCSAWYYRRSIAVLASIAWRHMLIGLT